MLLSHSPFTFGFLRRYTVVSHFSTLHLHYKNIFQIFCISLSWSYLVALYDLFLRNTSNLNYLCVHLKQCFWYLTAYYVRVLIMSGQEKPYESSMLRYWKNLGLVWKFLFVTRNFTEKRSQEDTEYFVNSEIICHIAQLKKWNVFH